MLTPHNTRLSRAAVMFVPVWPRQLMSGFFFFNDTATTEIYTLSLHDALPISARRTSPGHRPRSAQSRCLALGEYDGDRKSTRLNSSHANISYAVFCLKKKKN